MSKKKASPGKIILLILLILLLALLGFAGYVYFRTSRETAENDDIAELRTREPMDINDRYTVDEDGNMVCRLDKSDLYYYFEKAYGEGAAEEMIEDLEKETGLDIEAFRIDPEEPSVSLAAYYKKLRFTATAIPELRTENGKLIASISKIRIAGITIPAKWIRALDDVSFTFEIKPPFLTEVTDVSFEDGSVCLHGPLELSFLNAVDPEQGYDRALTYYVNDYREILDAGAQLSKDPSKAAEIFLNGVKEKGFRTVIEDYFRVAYPAESRTLMKHLDLKERFLKEYADFEFLNVFHPVATAANEAAHDMELLTDKVYRAFPTDIITISEGQFYQYDKPFIFKDFFFTSWYDAYIQIFDPESFRFVLIDDEEAFKGDTKKLSKYIDDVSSIKDPADSDKVYTLGYVCKTRSGQPLLSYNIKVKGIIGFDAGFYEISEELFKKLSDPSVIHIYTAQ